MHVVAVTRRPRGAASEGYRGGGPQAAPSREDHARALAELTGRDRYEWRLRVGTSLPWIVSSEPDAAHASARVAALRARGFGAISCASEDAVPWTGRGAVTLALEADELVLAPEDLRVRYDAIRVVVIATLDEETSREDVEHVRVSARPDRSPDVPVTRYRREVTRTRVAYLFVGPRQRSIRLAQGALATAVAAAGARTSFERFEGTIAALVSRLPEQVPVDRRLVDAQRARTGLSVRPHGRVSSNVRETDLAARLLAMAWIEGEVDPE